LKAVEDLGVGKGPTTLILPALCNSAHLSCFVHRNQRDWSGGETNDLGGGMRGNDPRFRFAQSSSRNWGDESQAGQDDEEEGDLNPATFLDDSSYSCVDNFGRDTFCGGNSCGDSICRCYSSRTHGLVLCEFHRSKFDSGVRSNDRLAGLRPCGVR
jgi:hypothetical protein